MPVQEYTTETFNVRNLSQSINLEQTIRNITADAAELQLVKQVIELYFGNRFGVYIGHSTPPRSIYGVHEQGFNHDEQFNSYHEALAWVLQQEWPIKAAQDE